MVVALFLRGRGVLYPTWPFLPYYRERSRAPWGANFHARGGPGRSGGDLLGAREGGQHPLGRKWNIKKPLCLFVKVA